MSWFYLMMPPPVYQKDTWSCWAAALESWIRVTRRPIEATSQDEWLGILDGKTEENGGLTKEGLKVMARMLGMNMKVYTPPHKPTLEMMSLHLHLYGHLYFNFFWLEVGHAQVIWGINKAERRLAFMDPDPHEGPWGTRVLEDYFSPSGKYVVGWPYYTPDM